MRNVLSGVSQEAFLQPRTEEQAFLAPFERYRRGLQTALRQAVPSDGDRLDALVRYQMGWEDEKGQPVEDASCQGKALRPTFCLLVCEALGGDWERALPAAAALELVHNFSLVHDDIQDGDTERRHRPTLWYLWGRPRALVAGDALLAHAARSLERLADTGSSSETQLRASALLSLRCLEMIEGQYIDISYESRLDIGESEYVEMVSQKTGALLRCSGEMGALLAGASGESVGAMGRCGHSLGIAFQVRDDILGIWGDTATTGKAARNDIWRKKKSFPVAYALEHATGTARRELRRIYSKPELGARDVELALSILEDIGARERSQVLAEEKASDALATLAQVEMSHWGRDAIEAMVYFLVHREY